MLRDLREIVLDQPIVRDSNLSDYKLSASIQHDLNNALNSKGFYFGNFTSFAITERQRETRPANYALIPNQYLAYASQMYDFAIELHKYFEIFDNTRAEAQQLVGSAQEIAFNIESSELKEHFDDHNDIELFSKFMDKFDDSYRLGSKRLINDEGRPRSSKDCFGSVLLKEINLPDVSSSIFGTLVYELCSHPTLYKRVQSEYVDKSRALNIELPESSSIREFVYQVTRYLEKKSIFDKLYSNLVISGDRMHLQGNHRRISSLFKFSDVELEQESLQSGPHIRWFIEPIHHENKFLYLNNQWTAVREDQATGVDFFNFKEIFNSIYDDYRIIHEDEVYKLIKLATQRHYDCRISKPFILLAGISGTGKTRFVRKQAENSNGEKCYELVSVRPDWHEPSDLLGYISRLSGTPQYVVTDVLRFIASAWKKVADAGLKFSVVASNGHEQIAIDGDQTALELLGPQWLCLDEMNLAPVEQYFADYLSVLETREWSWNNDSFTYKSDALLKPGFFRQLPDESLITLKNDLGFGENDNELWDFVIEHGLGLPPQLIVAGTVNMDETTHGFSRKVIDRALTFDFGEFYPNKLDEFFDSKTANKALTYPVHSHSQASQDYLPLVDSDGKLSIEFLEKINVVLDNTPFKLAYRALNELLLAVICYQPENELELKAVWDDFLMCKVLPRIEGDADKLAAKDDQNETLLNELSNLLESEFSTFWNASGNDASARPDLLREAIDANAPVIRIACRSKKKLEWMQNRLSASGFTSFWP